MGENTTFVGNVSTYSMYSDLQPHGLRFPSPHLGGEDFLNSRGVEIVNLDSTECKDLMRKFIQAKPEVWNEDIGEE